MYKQTRLLIFISAILFTSCYYKNEKGPDNEMFQSDGIVSDTTKVLSDVVLKGSFIKETWCNGSLQAWQKAIVPFEAQGRMPQNNPQTFQHLHGKHSFYSVCPSWVGACF